MRMTNRFNTDPERLAIFPACTHRKKIQFLYQLYTKRKTWGVPLGSILEPLFLLLSVMKLLSDLNDTFVFFCTHREGEKAVLRLVDNDAEDGAIQNDAD